MTMAASIFFAEAAPLAGRLAFAAVFAALIVWLLIMPVALRGEGGTAERSKPAWRRARVWAVVIAALQLAIYLFWS
jgi:hypothetical protein